jgi:elongation factor P
VLLEYPSQFTATFEATLVPGIKGEGIEFAGTEGRLLIDRAHYEFQSTEKGAQPVVVKASTNLDIDHIRNFLDSIRSRALPNGDVRIGHRSAQASHLSNISYMEKRRIDFDTSTRCAKRFYRFSYTGSFDASSAKFTLPRSFMISSTQMRPGMVIKFNNDLYSIFSVSHRTPGNLRGFVQAKMRSLRSGSMMEHRFSSEDKVEKALLEQQEMEYLYDDGEYYYFMNIETFEQMHLMKDLLGDATQYLIPNLKVSVEFYEGKPMSVELPPTVDLTVVETEPGLKGATVSNVTKPAKMETGLVVQVPPFIVEGEKIRVNTAEGTYQERA